MNLWVVRDLRSMMCQNASWYRVTTPDRSESVLKGFGEISSWSNAVDLLVNRGHMSIPDVTGGDGHRAFSF